MNNINVLNRQKCTGCFVCESSCPRSCIIQEKDQEGFLMPKVIEDKCIQCGICVQKCPQLTSSIFSKPKKVYAVQMLDKTKLSNSASGGLGNIIAGTVIEDGGIVYGCVYDENLQAVHARIENIKDVRELGGSKYVQSDFSKVYDTLMLDIQSGRQVVIIGTPCQIAAVRNFVQGDYSNLLLIDLICHGVPSPKLFSDYLLWKSDKLGMKILKYNFRDKKVWKWGTSFKALITTEKGEFSAVSNKDPYYNAFLYAESYRESCYQCIYAKEERIGDISIGDFWGIQDLCSNEGIDFSEGVSVCLLNTQSGQQFFEKIESKLWILESDIEKAKIKNDNLCHPSERPLIRNSFYVLENKYGFNWVYKHMHRTRIYYINMLKQCLPQRLKKIILKVLVKR